MIKRKTIQRTAVLNAVKTLCNHPGANDVYNAVSARYPNISKGTVYRNLNELVASGDITTLDIPDDFTHYDPITTKHHHAICSNCGKIFDLDINNIPDLSSDIIDNHGFKVLDCSIIFKGVCATCQKDNK